MILSSGGAALPANTAMGFRNPGGWRVVIALASMCALEKFFGEEDNET